MSDHDDGGYAYPSVDMYPHPRGMSLRDYFAAAALQGMLANGGGGTSTLEGDAALVYRYADAMLAERRKEAGK